MWTAGTWLLHHTVLSIRQFLEKHLIPTLPQLPYSLDLSPPDSFLFLKLKIIRKERRFQTAEDIITNEMNDFEMIPQTSFKQCFQKLKRWWEWCIAAKGNCFEVNNI
jgi:hypothetical protein